MGNSGSIHNVSSGLNDSQHQNSYHQQHSSGHTPVHWTQSFPRDSHHVQSQPHIKVLPELNEVARLRITTNGAILHSGGTISGRRDGVPPPLLQRSRTSINYDSSHRVNESHILSLSQERAGLQDNNYKRFGSEPDLRGSGDDEQTNSNAPRISKSKMVKNKKKKTPAPAPPQTNDDVVLNTYGLQQILPGPTEPQRKLRLFKTKAESKKSSQIKLATEASDLHFKRISPPDRNVELFKEPLRRVTQCTSSDLSSPKNVSNWKESKAKVFQVPVFRREKSFDITLLTNQQRQTENAIKNAQKHHRAAEESNSPSPREQHRPFRHKLQENRQRSSHDHRSTENRIPATAENRKRISDFEGGLKIRSVEPDRQLKKSVVETKLNRTRKLSQPAQVVSRFNFKKELEEATKRRSIASEIHEKTPKSNTKPIDRPIPKARITKIESSSEKIISSLDNDSIKSNTNPLQESKIPQLTKTFYFGMEKTNRPESFQKADSFGKIQMEVIDQFAKSIMTNQRYQRAASESSESALSSEEGYQIAGASNCYDDSNDDGGIQVHVRPTLPRRQLEIPRFSPAAAWRMLNEDQKEASLLLTRISTTQPFPSDLVEPRQPLEERIQRIYREPVIAYPDNKSGDSGISGDAGLPERPESPRINFDTKVGPFLTPWTPQQDLEEDTSSDGEITKLEDVSNYPSRGHVFSLSLPRENYTSIYEDKDKPGFSSLQKLKRTISGAFSTSQDLIPNYRNDNWLLSRSAPNSIDNSQIQQIPEILDGHIVIQPSSFSYLTGGKHVMYLPNQPIDESSDYRRESNGLNTNSAEEPSFLLQKNDITTVVRESLQDEPDIATNKDEQYSCVKSNKGHRGHRFTFQSTVRQIERRKIAEKLSKEAEQKEAQRLSELEAMRRVEEEFQRKRAREKASIRHQLRLFSLEENQCTSLPVDWQVGNGLQNERAEPDGAVSSPAPSPTSPYGKNKENILSKEYTDTKAPYIDRIIEQKSARKIPSTEILSEFRTSRRNYLEYRSDRRFDQPTEHPPIVCNIPSNGNNHSYLYDDEHNTSFDNYRRDFARGRSVCSSDSEISTPSGGCMADRRQQYRSRYAQQMH